MIAHGFKYQFILKQKISSDYNSTSETLTKNAQKI